MQSNNYITRPPRLTSLIIRGYRPFRDFQANLDALEVIVGVNGSGKSSLFEFLKFLRDSLDRDIPTEIVPGSIGQQIFHVPGPEKFWWSVEVDFAQKYPIRYQGELLGPVGRSHISFERVVTAPNDGKPSYLFMNVKEREGLIQDPTSKKLVRQEITLTRPNQLALSTANNAAAVTLYNLREYIEGWRFYSSFNIANQKIRRSVPVEQEPMLREDAGNLSAILFYLQSEHQEIFEKLQQYLRAVISGFKSLRVKARGGPGEVMAFWKEDGIDNELSLADLSDGTLRLICWIVLCVQPNPPPLICIDEPDQGVHPRTLPLLAGLFKKACERTQILLATHASYFLMQFELSDLAVMKKENGEVGFFKPKDSQALNAMLEDFGSEEIELLHRSDQLEHFV